MPAGSPYALHRGCFTVLHKLLVQTSNVLVWGKVGDPAFIDGSEPLEPIVAAEKSEPLPWVKLGGALQALSTASLIWCARQGLCTTKVV